MRGADTAADVDVVRVGGGRSIAAVDDGGAGAGRGGGGGPVESVAVGVAAAAAVAGVAATVAAMENRQSRIDGRSQCMGATAAMGNWVRRRGWKMVMAMAKAACEAADRVAPTMGLWWRGGDGDNGGSSEREEVQRWPSRARTGRARTVERVGRAKG